MGNEMWHVAVDGAQLPEEHETLQVRDLISRNAGKQIRVWMAGMAGWADPLTLPQFQMLPVGVESPAPAEALPLRRPQESAAPAAIPAYSTSGPPSNPRGAALPLSTEELQEQAGVFKALFDTSFNTLLTPKLIKAVYLLLMVILGLGLAVGLLGSLAGFAAGFGRGLVGLFVSVVILPLVAVLYLAMVRMGLEVIMAIFKIKEYVGILAEKAKQPDSSRG